MKMYIVGEDSVKFNTEKFDKLIVDGYYSRALWVPCNGVNPIADEFSVIVTKEKQTIMCVKPAKVDNRIVVAGQVWGNFRGSARIVESHTTGKVLWYTTSSKHCKGCVSFFVILADGETLTTLGDGRYGREYTVFKHHNGEITTDTYKGGEWDALNASLEEEGELV